MTRLEFRQIEQKPGMYSCRTSGSTGTAVVVQKYYQQFINLLNHQELLDRWHGWDLRAKTLKVFPACAEVNSENNLTCSNEYISGEWEQLMSFPSLFPVDLLKFKKVISYGEAWTGIGIDVYSSEEFGFIAIQCPYNKEVLHIMDNLKIVFTDEGMKISDLTHPYLRDYEIGDYAEERKCDCSLNLPAMSHVQGRLRGRIRLPDGTMKYPILGLYQYMGIERFQVFQESLTKLRLHYTGQLPYEAISTLRKSLGYNFEVKVVKGDFKEGKREDFICEM